MLKSTSAICAPNSLLRVRAIVYRADAQAHDL
jgi:hypothetical protein